MGFQTDFIVKAGTCGYVPTGGMIPEGADAVVMEEYCELFDENHLAVYDAVAHGKNVVAQGEDIRHGEVVYKKGNQNPSAGDWSYGQSWSFRGDGI